VTQTQPRIEIDSFWLPRKASTIAADLDWGFYYIYFWAVLLFIGVVTALVYFAYRYRRRTDNDRTSDIDHSTKLEVIWTAIPVAIVISIFFVGLKTYINAMVAPANAYEIQVTGAEVELGLYLPEREDQHERAGRSEGPPRSAHHELEGRDPQPVDPRVPHQAGRRSRHVHVDLVRGDR